MEFFNGIQGPAATFVRETIEVHTMGNEENEGTMISMNNADLNAFGNDFQAMDQNSAALDASGTNVTMPETVPQAVAEPEQGKKIVQFKLHIFYEC